MKSVSLLRWALTLLSRFRSLQLSGSVVPPRGWSSLMLQSRGGIILVFFKLVLGLDLPASFKFSSTKNVFCLLFKFDVWAPLCKSVCAVSHEETVFTFISWRRKFSLCNITASLEQIVAQYVTDTYVKCEASSTHTLTAGIQVDTDMKQHVCHSMPAAEHVHYNQQKLLRWPWRELFYSSFCFLFFFVSLCVRLLAPNR